MVAGTSAAQLAELGRSLGDVLISASAGPDDGAALGRSNRLIQFGRIAAGDDLALNLYVVAGERRFAFMWSVLGRDMMGCLVLVDARDQERMADARDVLAALADSGLSAIVVGVSGDACELQDVAQHLGLEPGTPMVSCDCSDRNSVKHALCAVLGQMCAAPGQRPTLAPQHAVSVAAGAV